MNKAYSYIRFSSAIQEKGDSLRRQTELAEEYAKENNLILDNKFYDFCLSGYKAEHKSKGALGAFLKLVEDGKIEKGSVFIFENLDRFSREQITDVLPTFMYIINHDIKLVTLTDKREYTKKSINNDWTQLIISIGEMSRANKESERKSQLISKAWENNRKQITIGKKKLTAKCPLWLRLESTKRESFEVIEDARKAIIRIFELKLEGKSKLAIARILNTDDSIWSPPTKKRKIANGIESVSKGWRESYIQKILNNRAVIGEFQPHKLINKKRIPVGEPIPDYYPEIVSKSLFYKVQNQIALNYSLHNNGGGKTGKANNLFAHIAECGECGGAMHYIDKGKGGKGGQYLRCDNNIRKVKYIPKPKYKLVPNKEKRGSFKRVEIDSDRTERLCNSNPINYNEFEEIFFKEIEKLNIENIFPSKNELQKNINNLEGLLSNKKVELERISKIIDNSSSKFFEVEDKKVYNILIEKIKEFDEKRIILDSECKKIESQLTELRSENEKFKTGINNAKKVYKNYLKIEKEHEKIDMRLKLRAEIKRVVNKIQIYSLKEPFNKQKEIETGIIQTMKSKYIDKIRISYVGSKEKSVIYLKSAFEIS